MKIKELQTVRTYYVTIETINGDFHYRTDWTGAWEVLTNGGFADKRWEPVYDTEELLQELLNEYLKGQK